MITVKFDEALMLFTGEEGTLKLKDFLGHALKGSLLVQVSCSRFDKGHMRVMDIQTGDLPCFSCGCPLLDVQKLLLHNQQTTHLAYPSLREVHKVKPMVVVLPFFSPARFFVC